MCRKHAMSYGSKRTHVRSPSLPSVCVRKTVCRIAASDALSLALSLSLSLYCRTLSGKHLAPVGPGAGIGPAVGAAGSSCGAAWGTPGRASARPASASSVSKIRGCCPSSSRASSSRCRPCWGTKWRVSLGYALEWHAQIQADEGGHGSFEGLLRNLQHL